MMECQSQNHGFSMSSDQCSMNIEQSSLNIAKSPCGSFKFYVIHTIELTSLVYPATPRWIKDHLPSYFYLLVQHCSSPWATMIVEMEVSHIIAEDDCIWKC